MKRARTSGSSALLVLLLLVCTLALATMLAYEAHDAARSHRATADRALHDYAAVAAWEFAGGVGDALQSTLGPAFAPTRARAMSPYELLPAPAILATSAGNALRCPDEASDTARYYFRIDFRDQSLAVAGPQPSQAMRDWLVDTITAHGRAVYQPDWPYAVVIGGPARDKATIAYALKYAEHRAPIAAYGFSTCANVIGPTLFRGVLSHRALLPSVLTGAAANDSMIAISVNDRTGHAVFESESRQSSPYSFEVPLEQVGLASARATIRPRAVDLLALGATPRTRVPILVGLLTLTAAMMVVAVTQLRREHELARLRADFISSVSHELRTPLSQILLFAETLNLGRVRSEQERRTASEVIVQEGRRLMHLVENILHFSRAERQMTRLGPEPVELAPAVQRIVDDWLPLAGAADVRIDMKLDREVVAIADRSALRQMLLNLLDNAVKYGPRKQTVVVGVESHNGRARLWVDDEGEGIPPRDRERVWTSFFRLERHANSSVAGSGIGLFVVRELARLHGGDAWVEESRRGGAHFVVELPVAPRAPGFTAEHPLPALTISRSTTEVGSP